MVDQTALKFNQAAIVLFVGAAWVAGSIPLVAITAAVMLIGTAWPKAALFKQVYATVFRSSGLLRPRLVPDREAPHRFAQGFGGIVLAAAYLLLLRGDAPAGWGLSLVVLTLAFINIVFNFCAGCFVFYQLERLGVIGSPKGA